MTSSRLTRLTVIAHELTHQWFGDNVTCGSWGDIWLNEGFATYGQYLCYDRFNGHDVALSAMNTSHTNVVSQERGSVYIYDTTDWQRIFDGRLTYDKGSSVLHMLRFVANDDDKFFKILQNYQQQYGGKTATTTDLKYVAQSILGRNLDTFFNQWIYGEGFPHYDAGWNQVNDVVYLHIDQFSSFPQSIATFAMPIEIKLYSAQGDTIVRVYDNQLSQVFQVLTNKIIDSIAIDPNQWLLCKAARPYKEPSLNLLPTHPLVYPNPVSNILYIAYKDLDDPQLLLYDAAGRKIIDRKLQWSSGIEQVDVQFFPTGVYIYRIISGGKVELEGKVLKK